MNHSARGATALLLALCLVFLPGCVPVPPKAQTEPVLAGAPQYTADDTLYGNVAAMVGWYGEDIYPHFERPDGIDELYNYLFYFLQLDLGYEELDSRFRQEEGQEWTIPLLVLREVAGIYLDHADFDPVRTLKGYDPERQELVHYGLPVCEPAPPCEEFREVSRPEERRVVVRTGSRGIDDGLFYVASTEMELLEREDGRFTLVACRPLDEAYWEDKTPTGA